MSKKNILTGIKPTGTPHIGNYLGAIKPALKDMHNSDNNYKLFVADYHAHTTVKDAKLFQEYVYEIAATWLACGLDPDKVTFYAQVDVPELFELTWLLSCHTPKGDLNRAHAYKALVQENIDKGNKDPDHGVNMGLFTYPLLMAADILLFDTNLVPVGKDQIQHVEIARSIASRINALYKTEVLVEPESLVVDEVAVVPGLDGRKMSKSYDNTIPLFCSEKRLKKLVNRITSDSSAADAPKDPDSSLVFKYYQLFASKDESKAFREELMKGISWGVAKAQLFEKINDEIKGPREIYNNLMENKEQIDKLLQAGAIKARAVAVENMKRIRKQLLGY
ncbi:MAG: tryptophan--tRNA ligase [Epsilonproteobacteria bacterium]|nr:MAG: tryptophan--tRNA ligase [Campylobacterota bacterium]RLA63105.1 MAG: tryptophan--tRNA ligase [Campylobacterota bacterium]